MEINLRAIITRGFTRKTVNLHVEGLEGCLNKACNYLNKLMQIFTSGKTNYA